MNRIIRERYPASKLPEDLRLSTAPNATVRVTVESEEPVQPKSFSEIRRLVEQARRDGTWPTTTVQEGVGRVRALREEWEDR